MSMPSTAAGPGWPTWFHTKSRPLKRLTVSHTMRRESSSLVRSAVMPWATAARRGDLAHHALHARRVHVHHRHLRALAREPERTRAPHARGGRRHDSDLSRQAHRSSNQSAGNQPDGARPRFYTVSGPSDTSSAVASRAWKPRAREGMRAACGILLPWRCKEISDEVPEVRVANQADGNEEGPDEVSRVIQMLESQVSARADGSFPATVLRMS